MGNNAISDKEIEAFYKRRIESGIEYLNRRFPGWLDRVDLGRLDMSSNIHSLLAQVYGTFKYFDYDEACERGFVTAPRPGGAWKYAEEEAKDLTERWRAKIMELRQATEQSPSV